MFVFILYQPVLNVLLTVTVTKIIIVIIKLPLWLEQKPTPLYKATQYTHHPVGLHKNYKNADLLSDEMKQGNQITHKHIHYFLKFHV